MEEWKEQLKEYVVYCKEEKKEDWINDIDALNVENFFDLPAEYEVQKNCFIKTAEIMKALDEGESWEQIGARLMEGHEYCQYPIGIIGHMMLSYSKHGTEFVKTVIGNSIELMTALKEEFDEEVEKEHKESNSLI